MKNNNTENPQIPCPDCGRDPSNEVAKSSDDWCKTCCRGRIDVRLKPQTPLTDAACKWWLDNPVVDADFARSLELKLQEAEEKLTVLIPEYTKAEAKYKRLTVENLEYDVSLTQERETNLSLRQQLQEAERQRDEARNAVAFCDQLSHKTIGELIAARDAVTAERDQLIKVVDDLVQPLTDEKKYPGRNCGLNGAIAAYSLLPHVLAKKGTTL